MDIKRKEKEIKKTCAKRSLSFREERKNINESENTHAHMRINIAVDLRTAAAADAAAANQRPRCQ